MSPLTQGLNYRSACDTVGLMEKNCSSAQMQLTAILRCVYIENSENYRRKPKGNIT